ncbi:transposase [uncultured Rubinisphaera sp.]|uniref:transposase n=1 Tax=uncultured Rubinisphaera sp. TaxID=1678686 RepID=UPI0030D9F9B9
MDIKEVKTTHIARSERGYDAGKKTKGRKRHVIVDTLGMILALVVHAADEQDYNGAPLVLSALWKKMRRLKVIFADAIYGYKNLPEFMESTLGFAIQIV